MPKPTVRKYMTVSPVVIASGKSLAEAHHLMRERKIRHLPVVDDGRLVGLVSQRDLYLLETLKDVDQGTETVEEAMTPEPYTVGPDVPLDEVAETMAEHRFGSAVVVEKGVVIGVFTTTDALAALASILRRGRKVNVQPFQPGHVTDT
jgi:acetoin utilization protein AcuB